MKHGLAFAVLGLALAACQSVPPTTQDGISGRAADASPTVTTSYDNHAQRAAMLATQAQQAVPHVHVDIASGAQKGWSLWHVRYAVEPPLEVTWGMRAIEGSDGAGALIPHRLQVAGEPGSAGSSRGEWLALEACTLRGTVTAAAARVRVEPGLCAAIVPGVGPLAALLPLSIERDGEWLRVGFFTDQARGGDARIEARRVRMFDGWVAINGSGPDAPPGNDWHLDRALRLGSEGGRAAVNWRDGNPSGFSLRLEHASYREGELEVLKLSVIADADGRTLAYVWADPQTPSIGISLGWLQAGLRRESD